MKEDNLLEPGQRFGEYTVVRPLGKGGMGMVYLLKHDSGGEFACKVLFPRMVEEHPEFVARFKREAEFASKIHHPNLASVYASGMDPDTGLYYLVMDYLPGGTLREKLDSGKRFSIDEAADLVHRVASALAAADCRNVVHRDVKPDNIMFAADGTPKLVDLGVAKFYGDPAGATTVCTKVVMVGTPAYMAPEQMINSRTVDIRADIYSLGVVFFEMLTGSRPWKDLTVIELLAKAVKGEALPDVRTIRPEVPVQIAQLLNLMCAPSPEKRIGSPQQVVDVFRRVCGRADAFASLAGGSAKNGFFDWCFRHNVPRIVFAAEIAVIVAVVVAVVWILVSRNSAHCLVQPHQAPAPEVEQADRDGIRPIGTTLEEELFK